MYLKLIGSGLALAGAFAAGWSWATSRAEATAASLAFEQQRKYTATLEATTERHDKRQDAENELLAQASAELAALRAQRDGLQQAAGEVKRVHVPTGCADVRIEPAVRVCFNAALSGTAEDAAACAAFGVHDQGGSEPVSPAEVVGQGHP